MRPGKYCGQCIKAHRTKQDQNMIARGLLVKFQTPFNSCQREVISLVASSNGFG